jgi:L-rhamnose isomerase
LLGLGLGLFVWAGDDVRGPLAAPDEMLGGVTITGPGPWLAKKSASGTTTMPTMTVTIKVTAPHSRRTKAQFTRDEV